MRREATCSIRGKVPYESSTHAEMRHNEIEDLRGRSAVKSTDRHGHRAESVAVREDTEIVGVMEDRTAKLEQLRMEPWFPDAQDAIVRPDQVLPITLYFLQRWAPRLGPDAVQLILWMRAQFARRSTPSADGWFELPAQDELAIAAGLGGEKRARAALRRLESSGFLVRESRWRFDRTVGRTVRDPDRYLISLADPVAPEDEAALLAIQAERATALAAQTTIFPVDGLRAVPSGDRALEGEAAKTAVSLPPDLLSEGAEMAVSLPRRSEGAESAVSLRGVPAKMAVSLRSLHDNDIGGSGSEAAKTAAINVRSNVTENVDSTNLPAEEIDGRSAEERDRRRALVDDLVASLGDERSRRFFVLIASRLSEFEIRCALAEALEARRKGTIRKSTPAYFANLVKRAAAARGISLSGRARGAA